MLSRFGLGLVMAFSMSYPVQAQTSINWPTYGGGNQRSNYNPSETVLSPSTVPFLKLHWSVSLGKRPHSPIVVTGVSTPSGVHDLVFVTTRDGTASAVDAASGSVIWTRQFGLTTVACGSQSETAGISEPPTANVATQQLLFVDGAGLLHSLALGTGVEQTGYPVEVIDSANLAAATGVSHASPTLIGSKLYLTTAILQPCENEGLPAHGQVIRFDLVKQQVLQRYYPLGNGTVAGGGIWGPGGVSVSADGTTLYAATANGLPMPQDDGNAEKVIALDLKLNPIAINGPSLDPRMDLDFGATPLVFTPPGCPQMLAVMNKSGILLTYDTTKIAQGPLQLLQISAGGGYGAFIGMPAYDPVTNAIYLGSPFDSLDGTYKHGLVALHVDASCSLSLLWNVPSFYTGAHNHSIPPMIANGVVYFASDKTDVVAAFNAADGTLLWQSGSATSGRTDATPVAVNGQLYVIAGSRLYALGL